MMEKKGILYIVIVLQALILVSALLIGRSLGKSEVREEYSYMINSGMISEAMEEIKDNFREPVDEKKLIYGAIKGMTESLDDPYSEFMPPEMFEEMMDDTSGKFGGLGIEIGITKVNGYDRLTVISVFEGNPAAKAGIEAGDYIVDIDGESTFGITLDLAKQKLRGEPGSKVALKVMRKHEDDILSIVVTRDIIRIKTVKSSILQGDIGYIRLTQFSDTTPADVDKVLDEFEKAKVKGIILDLRSNPGGTLPAAIEVASDFLREKQLVVYTKGRKPEDYKEFRVQNGSPHPWHPLIVLVDGLSASGSEIVVGAIKDHKRGLIVGNDGSTFGKGSVQSLFPLSDGQSGLKLTVANYYTPEGKNINEVGIEPDIKYPGLTASEVKMYRSLSNSKSIEEFVKEAGDDILSRLDKPEKSDGNNPDKELFKSFIERLGSENIVLSENLIKLAIAEKTKVEKDDYEFDPLIRFAIDHLLALRAFDVKPLG